MGSELVEDVALAELCQRAQDPFSNMCLLGDVPQALRDSAVQDLQFSHVNVRFFPELQVADEPTLHGRVISMQKGPTRVVLFSTTWDEADTFETGPEKIHTDEHVDARKTALCCRIANRVNQDMFLETAMRLTKELDAQGATQDAQGATQDTVQEKPDVVFTGQGLGGSIATMFALQFDNSVPVRKVVTFGSTPIGDEAWNVQWIYRNVPLIRYVVQGDARTLIKHPAITHPRSTERVLPRVQEKEEEDAFVQELDVFQELLQTTSHFLLKNVPLLRHIPALTQKVKDASFQAVPMKRYVQRLTTVLASKA